MANAIVVIVVIIIMLFAGKGAYKHLKGEGACCGGGSKPEIPKKKLDGTKLGEKTMVSYDREISNEELKKVVEDRGYHVVSIQ